MKQTQTRTFCGLLVSAICNILFVVVKLTSSPVPLNITATETSPQEIKQNTSFGWQWRETRDLYHKVRYVDQLDNLLDKELC